MDRKIQLDDKQERIKSMSLKELVATRKSHTLELEKYGRLMGFFESTME